MQKSDVSLEIKSNSNFDFLMSLRYCFRPLIHGSLTKTNFSIRKAVFFYRVHATIAALVMAGMAHFRAALYFHSVLTLYFFSRAIPELFCAAMPKSKSEHFDLSSKTKPTNKPRKSPLREKSKSSERDFRRGKSKSPRNSRIIPGKIITHDSFIPITLTDVNFSKRPVQDARMYSTFFFIKGRKIVLLYFDQCFGSLTILNRIRDRKFVCIFLTVGTLTSVFKGHKVLRIHKIVRDQGCS